ETRSASSIDVDRNKIVRARVVGRFGAGGQTGVGIPRAGHLGLNAFIFFVKDAIALLGDGQGQVLLPEAVSHGPRIAPPVARVNEDFDCHQLSLLTTFLAPLYNPTDASPIAIPDTIPCTTSPGETRKTPATTPRARANSGANLAGIPVLFAASTSAMISPTSAASSKPTM